MHQAHPVGGGERLGDLDAEPDGVGDRQRAGGQPLSQAVPVDEVHDQVRLVADQPNLVDAGHERVGDPGQQGGLAPDGSPGLGVAALEDLERPVPALPRHPIDDRVRAAA
jgi:hypothetical protein